MSASAALDLARAMGAARAGRAVSTPLEVHLGPAQAGAALRLVRGGLLRVTGEAEESVEAIARYVDDAFASGAQAYGLIGAPVPDAERLESTVAAWFVADPAPSDAAAGGYWLADQFVRGTKAEEVPRLARFLIGGTTLAGAPGRVRSVRRYPTGGLSEKQALILPPLLSALAAEARWCSPFLVARRLAHTGGTLDKLGTLPGFAPASPAMLARWTGHSPPVLYVAAGLELCPRDAAMYRMRGETGTVADVGLMAASILSKQAAVPVDGLVLDVLYGPTAFLGNRDDAIAFGTLCVDVGRELGIAVVPAYREASGPMGRSVGVSTEVLEAIELLHPSSHDLRSTEIKQALDFIEALATAVGIEGQWARALADEALCSGAALQHLWDLWLVHGVDPTFVKQVQKDPRSAILGRLTTAEVRAPTAGVVVCDWVTIADLVNTRINGFRAAGDGSPRLEPGGVELAVHDGAHVRAGELLLSVYATNADPELTDRLAQAFTIQPAEGSSS